MNLFGIVIVRNEADVIELSIRHHIYEGCNRVYVADAHSTDGSREVYQRLRDEGEDIVVVDDNNDYCDQQVTTNALVHRAGSDGANVVLIFDADEFFYACDGRTIAEVLDEAPGDVWYARSYQHLDWNTRHQAHKRLPKVVFRYSPDAHVDFGNHTVSLGAGEYGVLDMRELQYRGYSHFLAKTAERNARLSPEHRTLGYGAHHSSLGNATPEQMEVEWQRIVQVPTVRDPIPSRLPHSLFSTMETLI